MTVLDPHDMNETHLVMSHFTLPRQYPIEDRIAAAAAAGYDGIGLFIGSYLEVLDSGISARQLHDMLDEAGLALAEIEVLYGWADDTPSDQTELFERTAWDMADEFGCRYMQVIGSVNTDIETAAARFGALCDRAAEHDVMLGIEWLPFTDIPTVAAARSIVEAADRPNAGLCVDFWHLIRSGDSPEALSELPGELVQCVQVNDGPIEPTNPDDYKADCLAYRVPPGHGEFDAAACVDTLLGIGSSVPWSLEVCSAQANASDPIGHAVRCADAMRALLPHAS